MRTTIDIDPDLVQQAMSASGATTMKEAVTLGLCELVARQKRLAAIQRHMGAHPDFIAPPRRHEHVPE